MDMMETNGLLLLLRTGVGGVLSLKSASSFFLLLKAFCLILLLLKHCLSAEESCDDSPSQAQGS